MWGLDQVGRGESAVDLFKWLAGPTAWTKIVTLLGGAAAGVWGSLNGAPKWAWPILVFAGACAALLAIVIVRQLISLSIAGSAEAKKLETLNLGRGIQTGQNNSGTQQVFYGSVTFNSSASTESAPQANEPSKPARLPSPLTLFHYDFSNISGAELGSYIDVSISASRVIRVFSRLHMDFGGHSKFLAFYVPERAYVPGISTWIARNYEQFLTPSRKIVVKSVGESSSTSSSDLVFSGRIFVYHEGDLELQEAANLTQLFNLNGAKVQFRGFVHACDILNSIKTGRVQQPPDFEILNGIPHETGKPIEPLEEAKPGSYMLDAHSKREFQLNQTDPGNAK